MPVRVTVSNLNVNLSHVKPWELSRVLDEETLRDLAVRQRKTDQEIATMFGVTKPSIRNHRLKAHPPIMKRQVERLDHRGTKAIPWTLDSSQGHHMHPLAVLLRRRHRLQQGLPIPADAVGRIKEYEDQLRAKGMVLNYSRELGFHTVRRDPKLDAPDSIVRMPPEPKRRRGQTSD